MVRRLFVVAVLALALPLGASTRWLTDRDGAAVKWEPWGSAAIARAKKESKPLFVSIGLASSWECRRMQDEAFADAVNAKMLNFEYVPVLLDVIERPDVAAAYVEGDAFPVNVILTPELNVLASGGFMDAGELRQLLANKAREPRPPAPPEARKILEVDAAAIESVVDSIAKTYDAEHVAFGAVPRTPHAATLAFLLRYGERTKHDGIRNLVRDALIKLARSPIRDQIGGGFHRATRDASMRDPYFEKLLVDQAALASLYLDAWQLTKDPEFELVVRTTLDYIVRDLPRPGGGFDASQDAYSLVPIDGKPVLMNGVFYRWDPAEILRLVGETEAKKIIALYGDGPLPMRSKPLDPAITESLARVTDQRQRRPAPFREAALVAEWNGLAISALARAGAALNEKKYIDAAVSAARTATKSLWNAQKKTLLRAEGVDALASDYAMLIAGFLEVFDATSDPAWLDLATTLQQREDQLFWNASLGRYDGTASANAATIGNLLRLGALTKQTPAQPAMIFTSFSSRLRGDGASVPELAAAYEDSLRTPRVVVLSGDPRKKETYDAIVEAHSRFEPLRTVIYVPPKGPARERILRALPSLQVPEPVN